MTEQEIRDKLADHFTPLQIDALVSVLCVGINWGMAPAWAKYAAMDEDGTWAFFEHNPKINKSEKIWFGGHNYIDFQAPPFDGDWRNSLQERV